MKTLFIDHSLKTIGDMNELSQTFIEVKIKELDAIFAKLEKAEGSEIAKNITDDGMIKHALVRCLDYFNGSGNIDGNDYFIFYSYAYCKAEAMVKMIDENYLHLDM
jgi:hypothetical protein